MATGSSKNCRVIFISLVAAWLCSMGSVNASEHRSGIWKVLRAGHFSYPMNDEARVNPVNGVLEANGTRYRVWEYNWQEKRPAGHGRTLLLVFEERRRPLSYLGSYEFFGADYRGDVHPEIRGKAVIFPYHDIQVLGVKQAALISFENGPPAFALGSAFRR